MGGKMQEIMEQMGVNALGYHGMYGRHSAGNRGKDGSQCTRQSRHGWRGKVQVTMAQIGGKLQVIMAQMQTNVQ